MAPTCLFFSDGGRRPAVGLAAGGWELRKPGLPPSPATLPSPSHKALGLAPGVGPASEKEAVGAGQQPPFRKLPVE